jgi:hypothetical protein
MKKYFGIFMAVTIAISMILSACAPQSAATVDPAADDSDSAVADLQARKNITPPSRRSKPIIPMKIRMNICGRIIPMQRRHCSNKCARTGLRPARIMN